LFATKMRTDLRSFQKVNGKVFLVPWNNLLGR
jgi:hypothetical protein